MKPGKWIWIGLFLVGSLCPGAGDTFKLVEEWSHDMEALDRIGVTAVMPEGNLVTTFYKKGPVWLSRQRAQLVCLRGQGPDEIQDLFALCPHPEGIAMVELPSRIKIFKKSGDSFRCRRTLWLQRSRFYTTVSSVLFSRGKWFLAGYFLENFSRKYVYKKVFVKVYDNRGKYIKGLIRRTDYQPDQRHLMDYYLVEGGGNILYLTEDKLRVTVIPREKLEVREVVELRAPEAYKPVPGDFYVFKRYDDAAAGMMRDLDKWKTGYSRIVCVGYDQDELVLQIRLPDSNKANFMVLFYDGGSFQPVGRIPTDDRLLGVRDGRFYFYADGDPRYEEAADRCRIKVCMRE